jgi:mxaJ protein
MCSRFLEAAVLAASRSSAAILAASRSSAAAWDAAPLRVCADPDNPPFSQRDGGGFENRIAALLAADLGRPLQYHWLRDRRGFVRKTLGAHLCDVIIGLPLGVPNVQSSAPYYRSGFYFIAREGDAALVSFNDPRLPDLRIGVQLIGIDPGTSPVGYALARRGAIAKVVGFTVTSDDRPPAQRMVDAVAAGTLDSAVVWGPQAGWFVQQAGVPLRMQLASAPPELSTLPFEFSIALAVRPGDTPLQQALDAALQRRRAVIDAVLAAHGVPRTDGARP